MTVSCPQCKAPFEVDEPSHWVVTLQSKIHSNFSLMSPVILALVTSTGTFAGSTAYGLIATSTFAGYETALRWLGISVTPGQNVAMPLVRDAQVGIMMKKLWYMSCIAPGLVFVPLLSNLSIVPYTFMVSQLFTALLSR